MDMDWLTTSPGALLGVVLSSVAVYVAVLVATRDFGLRSFSKMSSFDFAITVAIGSVIASTVLTKDPPLLQALVGLLSLYALKIGLSAIRRRSPAVESAVDNQPILVMAGAVVLEHQLARAQMTRSDLRAKLREANVLDWRQVRAVVVETTGDVSVLHGEVGGTPLDVSLLDGVHGVEALKTPAAPTLSPSPSS